MRTRFIVGNWKMFKTVRDGVAFAREFRVAVADVVGVDLGIAPPFTAIHAVADALRSSNIAVGGQDAHWEPEGAFTGEVSAPMVREAGAAFVILGHSERRRLCGETDAQVHLKLTSAIEAGLAPLVCIGETLEERESGRTLAVIDRQLRGALGALAADQLNDLSIAYEPVWAIGTGRTATTAQAQAVHAHIRTQLAASRGDALAARCRLLYGGSVKPDNAAALLAEPDIDGLLVGGASLDLEAFSTIVAHARPSGV